MTKRVSNVELLAAINALTQSVNEINNRVTILESKDSKVSAKTSSKKTSKKASAPKKSEKKTQTYEEHLTEAFGSKEERTKFVELKKKVMAECSEIAKAESKYVKKSDYNKTMNQITESLNGKFNKSTVKKAFLAVAK